MVSPRILICGGRDFDDRDLLYNTLDKICLDREWIISSEDGNWLPQVVVIGGKAKGADTIGIDWAVINQCDFIEYPADWDRYGSKAGPLRNIQMLEEGKPDLVVAFPSPKSRGTYHMIKIAEKAGVEVIVIG